MPHDADGQRVDQRVALVDGVEDHFAADVRQAQGVAVAADAGHGAVHDAGGVRVVDGAEAQRVHHGHRAGAHRDDVADNPADAGRGALVGLHERRRVVRLDLERHGPAVAQVGDTGVLADAHEHVLLHLLGHLFAELAQVVLGGLVGAVLAPHHGVHGQLGAGGAAAQDLDDLVELVLLQAQLGPGELHVRGLGRVLHGVDVELLGGLRGRRHCGCLRHLLSPTILFRTEVKKPRPSVPEPSLRAEAGLDGVLGVRHEAHHVPGGVGDAGDVAAGAVRVPADVAEHHAAFRLEGVQGLLVRDVLAVLVLQRHGDFLARRVVAGPVGGVVFDPQDLVAAEELQVVVLDHRAGQKVRLGEDLEAVADAEDGQLGVRVGGVDDLGHQRREAGRWRRRGGSRRRRNRRGSRRRRRRPGWCRRARAATGVAPARRTARAASRSSRVPGKVTTPIFAPASWGCAATATASPIRGSSVMSGLDDLDVDDVLDDRVGQQGLRGVPGLGQDLLGHLAVDGQFEALALADSAESGEAQAGQRTHDGLPLRVENLGLGHDVDNDPGHPATPVREHWVRAQRSGAVSRRSGVW